MGLIDFIKDAGENILGKVGDLFGGPDAERPRQDLPGAESANSSSIIENGFGSVSVG